MTQYWNNKLKQDFPNVNITGGTITGISALQIPEGGTGGTTITEAQTNLSLLPGTDIAALVGGKIQQANLPAIAISDTFTVNTEAAMLALSAQTGDVAIRIELSKSFILAGTDPSQLADWQELLSPTDAVQSVNGLTGTVVISDIPELSTARNLSSSGDVSWSVLFDGSADVDAIATVATNSISNLKLADMTAGTIKGAIALGDPQDLSSTQVRTLLNIADGATANSTDVFLLDRTNHTGIQFAATISDFDTEVANNTAVTANTAKITNATHTGEVTGNAALTITDGAVSNLKLADMVEATIKGRVSPGIGIAEDLTALQTRTLLNVEDGATANSTDATLLNRTNHTGTQPGTTVTYNNLASGLTAAEVQGAIDELDGILDNLVIGTDVQAFSVELDAIAGLTSSANQLPLFTGSGAASLLPISVYAQGLLGNPDAATARGTLGLGNVATQNANAIAITGGSIAGISDLAVADGGTGASTVTAARTNLKAIGSDATGITGASEISNIVALTQANYDAIVTPDAGTIYNITDATTLDLAGNTTISTFGATLVDDTDAAAAMTTLGLGDSAVLNAGVADGVATLDSGGKIPSSQLPASVDEILEYANLAAFPGTGEASKIYVAQDTNLTYRWSGSAYVEISASLALGTTTSTAYQGDLGQIAYSHTSLTTNPHSVTAAQVGLGNVNNTSDLAKPISTATQTALNAKQASDAELTALAGLASAANQLPYFTGSGTAALTALSAFGRTLIDDATAAAAKTTLGIAFGTAAGTFAEGDNFVIKSSGEFVNQITGICDTPNTQPVYSIYKKSRSSGDVVANDYVNIQRNQAILNGVDTVTGDIRHQVLNTGVGTEASRFFFQNLIGGSLINTLNISNGLSYQGVDITPEEGTFTPVVAGSTTAGTGTYSKQVGIYRKIGKTTYVSIRLAWSAHTGTGDMRINGLPFASENMTDFLHSLNVAAPTGLTVPTDHLPYAVIFANASHIAMVSRPTTGGSLTQPYLALDTAVTDLVICGVYISA